EKLTQDAQKVQTSHPPTGTPRCAICPGRGLQIPQLSQRKQADCSSLRASTDHRFIVGALRARRTVCLLSRILLMPRVARARGPLGYQPAFFIRSTASASLSFDVHTVI